MGKPKNINQQPDNKTILSDTDTDTDSKELSVSKSVQLTVPVTGDEDWNQIVDRLLDDLDGHDLPDKVIQATELLLVGYPVYKVAAKIGSTSETVRRWLSRYPVMAATVANGRKLLTKWRMSKLEQQFLTAIERSQEVLEIPLNGKTPDGERVDPKVLTVVAAQSRYIIGLFAGQKIDITVTSELGDTVMKARQDALAYIANQLAEQQIKADMEPIETTYRVIDARLDNTGPMLDEEGNPPYGELGKLDKNDDGILCHICGGRFKSMARHLLAKHNVMAEEYETVYLLPEGSVHELDDN